MDRQGLVQVVHLVDAMGDGDHLWGKERVVHQLMRAQRDSGRVDPQLVTFSACSLAAVAANEGFRTMVLDQRRSPGPARAIAALRRMLPAPRARTILHSHGYKANIVARVLRLCGAARNVRLVSTCHGWVDTDAKLRFYNAVDRWSSFISDVTTVPDPAMLRAFPPVSHARYVANGVPDVDAARLVPAPALRRTSAEFIAGTLGRVSVSKGSADLLAAARACTDTDVVFAVAGAGELVRVVTAAGPNVRYAGYVRTSHPYLAALDVYVQASHQEGLSLALLEAMRAGKAIVATDVGATRDAVTDGESALLVPARQPAALLEAVLRLKRDPELAARLGSNARRRYEDEFRMKRQHEEFLTIYEPGERP